MKKLSIVMVLMILVFGMMQLAFAQTNTGVSSASGSSGGVATQIPKPAQTNIQPASTAVAVSKCTLSDELMKGYNQLIVELREAEGNKEKAEEITKKIISLKQAIAKSQEECGLKYPKPIVLPKPAVTATGTIDRCQLIGNSEAKYAYYKEIYSLPDEDIRKKGYSSREEVEKILKQLSDETARIKKECGQEAKTPVLECKSITCSDGSATACERKTIEKCGVNTFSVFSQCDEGFRNVYVECYDGLETKEGSNTCKSSPDWQKFAKDFCDRHCKKVETCICSTCLESPATSSDSEGTSTGPISPRPPIAIEAEKPIAPDSGEEINDYYKQGIEKITSFGNVDEQIKSLKELREEIDNLIEALLKSKNVIATNDVSGLVEKISVNPGMIKADNTQIKTIGKKVLMSVNNKPISIEPSEKEVLIKDENLEVKVSAISIQDNILRVGNAEVKLMASDVVNKLKIKPKSIELKEEKARAVYKIKVDEDRKLFGFISIKIEKELTTDADNNNVLEEHVPWYTFLTTG